MIENMLERKPHVVTEFFCVVIEDKGNKELYVETERCVGYGN